MVRERSGFTLMELMITIVIIGVLAAVAIPSMVSYVYRSYTSEATAFLGEIKQRQESYLSEYGQYCNVSNDTSYNLDAILTTASAWTPAGTDPPATSTAWAPTHDRWTQLGASPDGDVRFQYTAVAGPPATMPSSGGSNLGYTGADYWFVARARGDLDGDSTDVIFENYSGADHIWCSQAKGWE